MDIYTIFCELIHRHSSHNNALEARHNDTPLRNLAWFRRESNAWSLILIALHPFMPATLPTVPPSLGGISRSKWHTVARRDVWHWLSVRFVRSFWVDTQTVFARSNNNCDVLSLQPAKFSTRLIECWNWQTKTNKKRTLICSAVNSIYTHLHSIIRLKQCGSTMISDRHKCLYLYIA